MTGSMRGPSSEALHQLETQLGEALGSADPERTGRVGEELFSLAAVVLGEPRLRRALTDVSTDAGAKAQLVRDLFGGRADEIAVELLATGSTLRWTMPRDLAHALEQLGVETTVRSADDAGQVADELFAVEQLLNESPELRNALGDPARTIEEKRALLRSLLEGRTSPATARLVGQAVAGTHRTVNLAVATYQRVAAAVQGESVATVRTARALSDSEQERLVAALRRQYDRPLHLNVVVDPGVIGGVRVEVGDDVIDGTVVSRLDDARRRLAG